MKPETTNYLEPRVAQVEAGLDRLTNDMRELAGIVRTQGQQVESEIQKLVVAVTQAQAPRKTDWSMLISLAFLVMALGSAVFWPLNQTASDNKADILALEKIVEQIHADNRQPVIESVENQIGVRLNKVENWQAEKDKLDWQELQSWREQAMKLEPKSTK